MSAKIAAERALTESGKAVWFGAFEGDAGLRSSLGLVSDGGGPARFQTVVTDPDGRGRGLASTLVHYASTYGFDKLAAETLVTIADPDYLAIRIFPEPSSYYCLASASLSVHAQGVGRGRESIELRRSREPLDLPQRQPAPVRLVS
jgi:GNAT superfamily N-acetyltransferase